MELFSHVLTEKLWIQMTTNRKKVAMTPSKPELIPQFKTETQEHHIKQSVFGKAKGI